MYFEPGIGNPDACALRYNSQLPYPGPLSRAGQLTAREAVLGLLVHGRRRNRHRVCPVVHNNNITNIGPCGTRTRANTVQTQAARCNGLGTRKKPQPTLALTHRCVYRNAHRR